MSTRWSRRLAAVLLVSLGLNLFLGGVLVSRWVVEPPPTHDERAFRPFDRRAGLEVLTPAERETVAAIWRDNRREIRRAARGVGDARRALRAALIAEPFDPAAVDAAQRDLAARVERVRAVMTGHLIEIAAALPPEQRRRYFEATFAGRERGATHHRVRPLEPAGSPGDRRGDSSDPRGPEPSRD